MLASYSYESPNGREVLIALDESALPYRVHWLDLAKGEQHDPTLATEQLFGPDFSIAEIALFPGLERRGDRAPSFSIVFMPPNGLIRSLGILRRR